VDGVGRRHRGADGEIGIADDRPVGGEKPQLGAQALMQVVCSH